MQVELLVEHTAVDTPARQLQGLSDMEIVTVGARRYLLVAGAADGGLSSYEILNDGSLVASDDVLLSLGSGTQSVSDLTVYTVNGTVYVLPSGMADDNQVVYELGNDGSFTVSDSYSDAALTYANWHMSDVIEVGGNTHLFGSIWARSGYFQFDIEPSGDLTNPVLHPDDGVLFLGDVTAVHAATLRGNAFLFVASGVDSGLHSYTVAAGGTLVLADTAVPGDGGFSGISELASVDIGARSFIIMGSAGTNSLLVFRVSSTGGLNFIDKLVDTGDTYFAGVQALEVFTYGGRAFLLAGGADDGITLMEITYKGELRVITSVADTLGITLQNVTDIEVVMVNGVLNVFVSSATDHGFTQFVVSVLNGANLLRGGPVNDILTGGAQDDTIFGHGEDDQLYGMAGNDRLIDGRGTDQLWGGDGADIFEFVKDKRTDSIMDFEIGVDRIDLSDYPLLYYYGDITITATSNGATLQIGDDTLIITSMDNTPLTGAMFDQDDFIFG